MRGKKAKAIRKLVYGDHSARKEGRSYLRAKNQRDAKTGDWVGGTIFNAPDSLRVKYQLAKRRAKLVRTHGPANTRSQHVK